MTRPIQHVRMITQEQASRAYEILVRAAGACRDREDALDFVHHVSHPYDPAQEYRFRGALGLGGKFRNNGNIDDTPHVTCYAEDLDDTARSIIHSANRLLAELFPPQALHYAGRERTSREDRDLQHQRNQPTAAWPARVAG